MTQQDYDSDLVFRTNGEETFRIDGSKAWKSDPPAFALEVKSTEIPCESADLGVEPPPASITFSTSSTYEIARFTEEGFYYKGEFIEDAGEVYRLLKEVLKQIKTEQSQWSFVMQTLDQHNQKALGMFQLNTQPRLNGISCPECQHELMDSNPSICLTSWPPQYRVHCPSCDYTGTRY